VPISSVRAGGNGRAVEGDAVACRIVLVDDHRLVREAVARLIESEPGNHVVGQASGGDEAVALVESLRPDVVVTDLTMPRLSGVETIRRIRQLGGPTRCLALSVHETHGHVTHALQAGAAGYVVKSAAPSELIEAIAAVAQGRSYLSPSIAHCVVDAIAHPGEAAPASVASLTGREREVLQLIAEGLSSKEIAAALGVSVKTVETHRCNLMGKLKIRKASRLVRIAIHEGLVAP